MVIFRNFPYNNALFDLFGLVVHHDPCFQDLGVSTSGAQGKSSKPPFLGSIVSFLGSKWYLNI